MRTARNLRIALLLGSASALVMPAASHAGTVYAHSLEGCEGCGVIASVFYSDPSAADANPGAAEDNTVTVSTLSPVVVSIRDETATMTVDPETRSPCELKSAHEVWCTVGDGDPDPAVQAIARLGDLDDSLAVTGPNQPQTFAHGGPGHDVLTAGTRNDFMYGDAGNDVLDGGLGRDQFTGGDGIDTATYSSRTTPVTVTVGTGSDDGAAPPAGEAEGDSVQGDVERVLGGTGADVLVGNSLDNLLAGNGGNDRLDGGTGSDVLSGGAGNDTISYASRTSTQPLSVRLDGAANDGADPDRDGVSEPGEERDQDYLVENVTGGAGADRLTGNNYANVLTGGGSTDRLDGGLGSDTLDGGQGLDTTSYGGRTAGVAVLLDGVRNDGSDPDRDGVSGAGEERDQDISIENATGGEGPDLLSSLLTGANILTGNGGADRIFARDGGTAKDYVNCGAGTDRFQVDPSDAPSACETIIP